MKSASLILAAMLAACSPAEAGPEAAGSQSASSGADTTVVTQEAPRYHPVSTLQVIDVTIEGAAGTHVFNTELAVTPQEQARGLMFRTELGDDEAMLFPSYPPEQRSFWMKNTPLSLDIIFIGTDGRISNIAANTVPYSLESVPSKGIASAVFEVRAGLSEELGIKPGDLVTYKLPE